MLLGRVVDEDIESPEALDRSLNGLVAKCFFADVAADQQTLSASLLDRPGGLFGVLMFIVTDNGDVRAFAGEGHGNCATNSAVAAGDERHLAFELSGGAVVVANGHGLRPHGRLQAGPAVLVLSWTRWFLGLLFSRHGCYSMKWKQWEGKGRAASWQPFFGQTVSTMANWQLAQTCWTAAPKVRAVGPRSNLTRQPRSEEEDMNSRRSATLVLGVTALTAMALSAQQPKQLTPQSQTPATQP